VTREVRVDGGGPREPALDPVQQSTHGFRHKHTGISGDAPKVKAAYLDTRDPFTVNSEPVYTPINAPVSGRLYRIQVIEVTDPETGQVNAVIQAIQVTPAS